jgi:hypothetical protein
MNCDPHRTQNSKAAKPPKLALTAAIRKLLVILKAILKTHTSWSEHAPLQNS